MMKFVLCSVVLVAAVCAAPADNKPGQQGRTDGLDQAESAWNNPNAWNAQNAWGRDTAAWNHPNTWNHGSAWNHPSGAWNRGYNNRNDMTAARPGSYAHGWMMCDTIPPTVGLPVLIRGTATVPVLGGTAGLDVVPLPDGQLLPGPLPTAGTHADAYAWRGKSALDNTQRKQIVQAAKCNLV
uniref:Secreted protein n=1 Tax=Anopheles culicifacies TaxID=139723 RepID=A0A182MQW5_9DIPT